MISEQEYIDYQDGIRIRIIKDILREIVPENSSVIDLKDYTEMMRKLSSWEEKLFELVKVE